MATISMEDFKDATGKVDWGAYRKAEIANGNYCYECRAYITYFGKGYSDRCVACKALDGRGEVEHSSLVRCPKCGDTTDPDDGDSNELFREGEHTLTCGECEHDFEVMTTVSYSFGSPARLPDEEEESDEEADDAEASPSPATTEG